MNRNTVSGDIIGLNLRQLGATSIRVFPSRMHIANFDLGDGFIVSYVFNITRKDKFFLQRMRPYSMVKGMYADQKEIIDFIKDDIERFRKSIRLNDAEKYIALAEKVSNLYDRMDHIFLHHKVDSTVLDRLNKEFDELAEEVENIHSSSEIIRMH